MDSNKYSASSAITLPVLTGYLIWYLLVDWCFGKQLFEVLTERYLISAPLFLCVLLFRPDLKKRGGVFLLRLAYFNQILFFLVGLYFSIELSAVEMSSWTRRSLLSTWAFLSLIVVFMIFRFWRNKDAPKRRKTK